LPFLTDAQLKTAIAKRFKTAEANLAAAWTDIAADANTAAYQAIVRALAARGFTQLEIDAWDHGAEFQRDIALYFAFVNGGIPQDYSDKFIDKLDRRAELATVTITEAGVVVEPDTDEGDAIVSGTLDFADDIFQPGVDQW
jgi:hypothetical protein